jgi:DNA-binding response OmpR family regulator
VLHEDDIRERILVASDDVALVNRLDWLLTEARFAVVIVASLEAACLAMTARSSFALVIVDIRLPDGADIDRVLGGTPVVVIGATPAPEVRAFIETHGGVIIDEPIVPSLRARLEQFALH